MAFDWTRYMDLARDLAARGDEASARSAVSRAYYAVFGQARAKLPEDVTALAGNRVSSHALLWDTYREAYKHRGGAYDVRAAFPNTDYRVLLQIGNGGERLHRRRVRADYDPDLPSWNQEVATALHDAEALLVLLERLD